MRAKRRAVEVTIANVPMKTDARDGVLTMRRVVSETETKCRVISRHVPRRRAVRATLLATISHAHDVEHIFRVPSARARERGATREDVDVRVNGRLGRG